MPSDAKVPRSECRSVFARLIRMSTSRVARTRCHVASANPPISAIGHFEAERMLHTCRSAPSTRLPAMRAAPAVELFHEMKHHFIMLLHLRCMPLPVSSLDVPAWANLSLKTRLQELVTRVH